MWRRVFYWVDHLLEGRQHKKELELLKLPGALDLSGVLYFGRPGILLVEGTEADHDAFVREAKRIGKAPKPKNTSPPSPLRRDPLSWEPSSAGSP